MLNCSLTRRHQRRRRQRGDSPSLSITACCARVFWRFLSQNCNLQYARGGAAAALGASSWYIADSTRAGHIALSRTATVVLYCFSCILRCCLKVSALNVFPSATCVYQSYFVCTLPQRRPRARARSVVVVVVRKSNKIVFKCVRARVCAYLWR